jgi:hypothetical protein
MKSRQIILSIAALLSASTAGSALNAQSYGWSGQDTSDHDSPAQGAPDYGDSQQQYEQQQQAYRQGQRRYQDQYWAYQNRRDQYETQRQAYERRRARFERERANYDAEYGPGAFKAYYRDRPDEYDARFGADAYDRDFDGR